MLKIFSYTTFSSFLLLNRTLCEIKHGSTSYLEKKKIIVQRRRGYSMLPFTLPLARNKENGNIEFRILIGCVPYTMKPVYTLPAAKKGFCRGGFILKHCPWWTYQESRILLSIISTPSLTFLIPFVIINTEFWQWIHRSFKPHLAVTFIFPTCKNTYDKYEGFGANSCASVILKNSREIQRNLTPLHGSHTVTFYYT